jgi:hypothetical protein
LIDCANTHTDLRVKYKRCNRIKRKATLKDVFVDATKIVKSEPMKVLGDLEAFIREFFFAHKFIAGIIALFILARLRANVLLIVSIVILWYMSGTSAYDLTREQPR